MNNFSFKHFFLLFILSLILSLSLSLFVSNRLAKILSNDLRDREMTLLLDALEAGPLAIARLNSSAFSQQALERLMSSSNLKVGPVNAVSVIGGFQNNYKYAYWESPNKIVFSCTSIIKKEFHYPDSLNPFIIIIKYDKCKVLAEEKQIYRISLLGIFIVFVIVSITLILSFLPILQSLKVSFIYLKNPNDNFNLSNIKFIPLRKLTELAFKSLQLEKEAVLANLSRQVAHDIRSPLSALKMAISEIESVPMDYRYIINNSVQRINDIANNLLHFNYEKALSPQDISDEEILFLIIDSLVSEKKLQCRNHNIKIELSFKASHLLFVKINRIEFYRVLSNLINNSIEALDDKGSIVVSVREHENGLVVISIEDDGKGIPKDILAKIGQYGFSYGKKEKLAESGSGLGVHHARKTIESFGGQFEIISKENEGTIVTMTLSISHAPKWFTKVIDTSTKEKIYILESDESLQQIWKEKIGNRVESFFSKDELLANTQMKSSENIIYLIENDIPGDMSGLDLIKFYNISDSSFLVIDYFDDKEIRERCSASGIKIIPKTLIQWIVVNSNNSKDKRIFDYVYIEDDEIPRMVWENKARKKNIKLLTLENTKKFDEYIDQIDKHMTQIYLDSTLGKDEVRGEDFAQLLHEKGYENLFIASGYDKEVFAHLPWLNVAAKKCPF